MSEFERRVLYLPPDQWRALRIAAAERRTSVSGLLRSLIDGGLIADRQERRAGSEPIGGPVGERQPRNAAPPSRPETAARSAQASRDAILKRVNRASSV